MESWGSRRLLFIALGFSWVAGGLSAAISRGERPGCRFSPEQELKQSYEAVWREMPSGRPEPPALPVIKTDASHRRWAAWEDWETERSRIRIGCFGEDGRLARRMTVGVEGFNYAPDIAFDLCGSVWATWVNFSGAGYSISVQDFASRKRWIMRLDGDAAAADPRILFGRDGAAWVFWSETSRRKWQIVYRIYDGRGWSAKRSAVGEKTSPHVNPAVAVDEEGVIWLAWSGYDGNDYEIYLIRREGETWSAASAITENRENDLFPSLGAGPQSLLAVGWMRSSAWGNQVFASTFREDAAAGETAVSPLIRGLIEHRLDSSAGGTSIVWKSGDRLDAAQLTPELLAPRKRHAAPSPREWRIFNPARDENVYIGFGDSITYGYIDRLPTPELGYPPRLRILLNENFGDIAVINEGIGGETTLQGLARIDEVLEMWDARYILIMEGTNDVITTSISMETAAFDIGEIARKSREAGLFPTITTILPREDWLGVLPFYRNRLLALNELIRELPAEMRVSFIDMYDLFLNYPEEDGGLLAVLSDDLKHPSEKGYQFMAEAWFNEIRNYPFPPVQIKAEAAGPKKDIVDGPARRRLWRTPGPSGAPDAAGFKTNFVSWAHNPKIFDRTRVKGYKIYRRNEVMRNGQFRFVALVEDALQFLDGGLPVRGRYEYLIAALRDDDIEGPCADPVRDH